MNFRAWRNLEQTLARAAHALTALAFLVVLVPASCNEDRGLCDGATCVCERGSSCNFGCPAPPCNAICEGDNPMCGGFCSNGDCQCGPASTCNLDCLGPPCHALCAQGSTCTATCGNGDCVCGVGASCAFTCFAGPCHVKCEGSNPRCDGQCANGDCTCSAGGTCAFVCKDANCHVNCETGSKCILECPNGDAGKGCDFTMCAAGATTPCPDGRHVTCAAACP